MAGVNVDEVGLKAIADEYDTLANNLDTEIVNFGSAIEGVANKGIEGDESVTKLLELWTTNVSGYDEGLEGAMKTYVTELRNSSLKIYDYLANLKAVDNGKAEELDEVIQVENNG
ncbi:hypothetical protein SAMN02745247_00215 [Butyrivibrio hungatei DSM 14810]|uniref:Proteins of 100 residues with WXG n=1 Tax=Butyrivibrio hungatei DSM 14810 TaxID=1121132 RepID=A0A1M7RRW8_9FIRM|nr:hypothetical protein [Butyrivibrio hungatei]SHN48999.1 hypothetical protein SAMN02745247_00215 [Butyrivibrio hungatei DSM 14810]